MDLDLADFHLGTRRPFNRTPAARASRLIGCAGHCALEDGGWPLPTAGGQRRTELTTCTVRPNLSSAVGSEDKDERTRWNPLVFIPFGGKANNGIWGRCPLKASAISIPLLRLRLPASSSQPRRQPC